MASGSTSDYRRDVSKGNHHWEEIAEAIEAFFEDPTFRAFRFASGHVLNVEAAVAAHAQAKAALAKKDTTDAYRRTMVHTAVVLAVPEAK